MTPRRERLIVATITAVQVTAMIDFVIMMPLGPQLMRELGLTPRGFGIAVAAYPFAAAISGLAVMTVLDRVDRRRALLTMYGGFILATLACAAANGFASLTAARFAAGAFGGIMGGLLFAIIGDCVPEQRRGAATGTVMSGFAIASIVGIPLGLEIATRLHWHATFIALAGACAVVWIGAALILPPLRGHLGGPRPRLGAALRGLVERSGQRWSLVLAVLMMFAGFTVIPYLSPYLVSNVGLSERDLRWVYLVGGIFTVWTSRLAGRLSDRLGAGRTFTVIALLSLVPLIAVTNLPPLPLPLVLGVTAVFFILVSGRFVPYMALVAASVERSRRAGFLALHGAVQAMASGSAATVAGSIVGGDATRLTGYRWIGLIAVMATLAAVIVSRRVISAPPDPTPIDG